ncbi:MFS transporter [Amycolatopsis thermophila]|uniref:MFS family permease n=1 Tax=Amycolatopsis thermophila TaxID=206084 RepID=A0ABU0EM26_9PSEU|nr:MFS transporter [Amycolatopsis thermophila]MDQ0376075.1 MFS family permease [Amycolatopsis thermophila]
MSPSPGRLTAVLAFAGVVVAVMQTLMVPLLADLPSLLHSSSSDTAWVITITLLTGAVATPVLGRLGDMHGKRRMMLVALTLQVAGCLVCGLTTALLPMMIGRGLQGFAIGAIPLGISIMRDELPPERLGGAVGLMSSSLGIGGALALPVAALVAEHFDWHILFLGAGALGLVGLVLLLVVVPESAVRSPGRFDVPGAIGLSAALVCLLLAISKGGDWGWGSARTLGFAGAAVALFVAWGFLELRTAEPLVDLRTTARRPVLLTNLASITVGFALYATQLVPPQLLQLPAETGYGLGLPMVIAGLCVAPSGVMMMAMSPVAARLIASRGPKVSLLCGITVLGVAYTAGLGLTGAGWQLAIFSGLAGAGVGLAYAAMPSLIMGAVPATETAAANGLNTLMRSIGTSSSSAVVGMVLAGMTVDFGGTPVPSLGGFRVTFLIGCAACVAGLVVAFGIPGRVRAADTVLAGVVRSAGGVVGAAAVTLIGKTGQQAGTTATDVNGRYSLNVPDGEFVLVCSAPGYQPEAAPVSGPGEQDFALSPAGRVTGTVGVPGALLIATDERGEVAGTVSSRADGSFELAGLLPGRYALAVAKRGYRTTAVPVRVGDGTVRCDLTLSPCPTPDDVELTR